MCDIIQFIITVPLSDCTSVIISQYVMQDVLMKFGLCHLVIIDDIIPFKSNFTAMCDCLTINYKVIAKRNHKDVSVEHVHRFLNKVVNIASKDRDTVSIFFRSRD